MELPNLIGTVTVYEKGDKNVLTIENVKSFAFDGRIYKVFAKDGIYMFNLDNVFCLHHDLTDV